ncbi:MAG: PstS family phosphate ABC transporter substrate-binding protein [Opitutaceae bacterium]|nr:PstS family phosphate ABC transporter substrate-binding protein [Cytophagales bacterium]
MKRLLLVIALAISSLSFSQNNTPILTIRGSESGLRIMTKLREAYGNKYKDRMIDLAGFGSTMGIVYLKDNQADIAVTSRKMTDEELAEFQQENVELTEVHFAKEAFTVVVNKSNPVTKLTKKQVGNIFAGYITNWKDVGGANAPIRVFIRSNTSGCYLGFKELFLDNMNYTSRALMLGTNAQLKGQIAKDKSAISYLGFGSVDKNVKMLKISIDDINYFSPTAENIANLTYPIYRTYHFYFRTKDKEKVKHFIEFVKSDEGKNIILRNDHLPAD